MRWVSRLIGLVAGLGCGTAQAQAPGSGPANPSLDAFKTICLTARADPAATAKAAVAAHWSPIAPVAIAAMGGTAFEDTVGFRAPDDPSRAGASTGAATQGVWVIIGRTPMPGFGYPADSCAVFAAPADGALLQAVRAWAGGAPTVDEPSQQLIQYAFVEGGGEGAAASRALATGSIDAAAPGLQAGTISLVTVVPGAKRSVLVYSVVNP